MARRKRNQFQKLIDSNMTWPVIGGAAILVGALFVFSTFSGAGVFSKAQLDAGMPGGVGQMPSGGDSAGQNPPIDAGSVMKKGNYTVHVDLGVNAIDTGAFGAGGVMGSGGLINCQMAKDSTDGEPTCDATFPASSGGLTLTASTTSPYFAFDQWEGAPCDKDKTNPTCVVGQNAPELKAVFKQVKKLTYTVKVKLVIDSGGGTTNATAGTVSGDFKDPNNPHNTINCTIDQKGQVAGDCKATLPGIDALTLSVFGTNDYEFVRWEGAPCDKVKEASCLVDGQDADITAHLRRTPPYTLSVGSGSANYSSPSTTVVGGFFGGGSSYTGGIVTMPTIVTIQNGDRKVTCLVNNNQDAYTALKKGPYANTDLLTGSNCKLTGTGGMVGNLFTVSAQVVYADYLSRMGQTNTQYKSIKWDCTSTKQTIPGNVGIGITKDTTCSPTPLSK